jgi:hypothetical protein
MYRTGGGAAPWRTGTALLRVHSGGGGMLQWPSGTDVSGRRSTQGVAYRDAPGPSTARSPHSVRHPYVTHPTKDAVDLNRSENEFRLRGLLILADQAVYHRAESYPYRAQIGDRGAEVCRGRVGVARASDARDARCRAPGTRPARRAGVRCCRSELGPGTRGVPFAPGAARPRPPPARRAGGRVGCGSTVVRGRVRVHPRRRHAGRTSRRSRTSSATRASGSPPTCTPTSYPPPNTRRPRPPPGYYATPPTHAEPGRAAGVADLNTAVDRAAALVYVILGGTLIPIDRVAETNYETPFRSAVGSGAARARVLSPCRARHARCDCG